MHLADAMFFFLAADTDLKIKSLIWNMEIKHLHWNKHNNKISFDILDFF